MFTAVEIDAWCNQVLLKAILIANRSVFFECKPTLTHLPSQFPQGIDLSNNSLPVHTEG